MPSPALAGAMGMGWDGNMGGEARDSVCQLFCNIIAADGGAMAGWLAAVATASSISKQRVAVTTVPARRIIDNDVQDNDDATLMMTRRRISGYSHN